MILTIIAKDGETRIINLHPTFFVHVPKIDGPERKAVTIASDLFQTNVQYILLMHGTSTVYTKGTVPEKAQVKVPTDTEKYQEFELRKQAKAPFKNIPFTYRSKSLSLQ